jgi:hypothetical protein
MRVQFQTQGGIAYIPGLQKPITIDVDALPEADASRLRQLVSAVRFFDLPTRIGSSPRGAADMRQYTITIEDGGRHHTVRVAEPVTDPALQEILDTLRAQGRRQRSSAP